jgi:Fe-S-cluster containining protein
MSSKEEKNFCMDECGGLCCQIHSTPIKKAFAYKEDKDSESVWIFNHIRVAIEECLKDVEIVNDLVRYSSLQKDKQNLRFAYRQAVKENKDLSFDRFIEQMSLKEKGVKILDISCDILKKTSRIVRMYVSILMTCEHFDEEMKGCDIYDRRPGFCQRFICGALRSNDTAKLDGYKQLLEKIHSGQYKTVTDIDGFIQRLETEIL